jgi:L-ribulose-5-phosphate 3-epimerase
VRYGYSIQEIPIIVACQHENEVAPYWQSAVTTAAAHDIYCTRMRRSLGNFTRRQFIGTTAAASVFPASRIFADVPGLRIGITDWNLDLGASPEAVPLASKLGFEGVQVSFGRRLVNGKMPADDSAIIARYLKLSAEHNLPIDGTCVDKLHDNGLKSDKLAPKWVMDSIRLTKDLKTKVLLLPFFGRWSMQNRAEMDYVGDALRELAPEAEKTGVILGLEDMISAEDNVRIMERSRSQAVLVYYDVGNSTKAGFDIVKEIRWLGKDRICQFHLKDNPHFMGEGEIQFPPVLAAIKDIGFTGYANLETDARPGTLEADLKRNLDFIRGVKRSA